MPSENRVAFPSMHCPLCKSEAPDPFYRDKRRPYHQCPNCALIFVPPSYFPDRLVEKAEYDLHENQVDDPGYRRFLSRLAAPLQARLPEGAHGLDFGCGPGPALAAMLEEHGFRMALYDPFYAADSGVLEQNYDFITSTEVFEHLHRPDEEIERLIGLLRPNGLLGIMTKLSTGQRDFPTWHYKNDKTHVIFFSEATFTWLAGFWDMELEVLGKDVVILKRKRDQ